MKTCPRCRTWIGLQPRAAGAQPGCRQLTGARAAQPVRGLDLARERAYDGHDARELGLRAPVLAGPGDAQMLAAFRSVLSERIGARFMGARVDGRVVSGCELYRLGGIAKIEDAAEVDDPRALPQEFVWRPALGVEDAAGHREHLSPLIERVVHGHERVGVTRALDGEDREAGVFGHVVVVRGELEGGLAQASRERGQEDAGRAGYFRSETIEWP